MISVRHDFLQEVIEKDEKRKERPSDHIPKAGAKDSSGVWGKSSAKSTRIPQATLQKGHTPPR